MKKLVLILTILCALLLCTTAVAADKFAFEKTPVTVFEGEEVTVPLIREGKFAQDGTLTWSVISGQRSVSVADDGTITGLERGEASIACVLKLNNGTSRRANLTVKVARRVTEVSLDTSRMNVYDQNNGIILELMEQETEYPILVLPIGKNVELKGTALPEDATNRKLSFESSNTAVALVQKDRILKGTKVGECDLRVYSQQNPEVEQFYHVIVVQPVTKVTMQSKDKVVLAGKTIQLDVSYQPASASMKEVNWTSENPAVATVDEYGVVTGVKRGSATIRAVAADGSGKSATVNIAVQQGPERINLRNDYEVINVGTSKRFNVTVLPANTNNQNVYWVSSDSHIASVAKNGTIKGVSVGTCNLTCVSEADASVTASMTLQVQQPVTKIEFLDKKPVVDVGSSIQLSWKVSPDNATNPGVTLRSGNEKTATVDQNGRVTGVKKGNVKIIATSTDGSQKSGAVSVRVRQPVWGVHFRQDIYHVPLGGSLNIHSVTEPQDADDQGMTWYTEDAYISTVSKATTGNNYGTFLGRHMGSTTVTCITNDGGYTANAILNVDRYNDPVEIRDLYLNGNKIKISLVNVSNMNLTRLYYNIEVYDVNGYAMPVTSTGTNVITGYYLDELAPQDLSVHGRFHFDDFIQPTQPIGGIIMRITGYKTDETYTKDGKVVTFSRDIPAETPLEARYPSQFMPTPVNTEGEEDGTNG